MSFISDILDFERFNLGDIFDRIKDDPKRLLLGVDPFSTGIWNAVLGKDDKPIVNWLGGPTSDTFVRAQAEGIDTGAGKTMHDIAGAIAGSFAGGFGANQLGGLLGTQNPIAQQGLQQGAQGLLSGGFGGGGGFGGVGGQVAPQSAQIRAFLAEMQLRKQLAEEEHRRRALMGLLGPMETMNG